MHQKIATSKDSAIANYFEKVYCNFDDADEDGDNDDDAIIFMLPRAGDHVHFDVVNEKKIATWNLMTVITMLVMMMLMLMYDGNARDGNARQSITAAQRSQEDVPL